MDFYCSNFVIIGPIMANVGKSDVGYSAGGELDAECLPAVIGCGDAQQHTGDRRLGEQLGGVIIL